MDKWSFCVTTEYEINTLLLEIYTYMVCFFLYITAFLNFSSTLQNLYWWYSITIQTLKKQNNLDKEIKIKTYWDTFTVVKLLLRII